MTVLLAIDPGDHMGWCVGTTEGEPYAAGTDPPGEFFLRLERWVGTALVRPEIENVLPATYQLLPATIEQVVFEGYTIDEPAANQGSDVPTLQYIGVIKYICSRAGVPFHVQHRMVKGPAKGKLRNRKIKPLPGTDGKLPNGGHATDAQVHWWAWVWRYGQ